MTQIRRVGRLFLLSVTLLVLVSCYPPAETLPAGTRPDGAVRLTTPPTGASGRQGHLRWDRRLAADVAGPGLD
ncbi:MAG: hypothetical protein OEW09_00900 [Anaerolineae bacterium]|nr:hypothetical protein [Anaerolineae bacterium]